MKNSDDTDGIWTQNKAIQILIDYSNVAQNLISYFSVQSSNPTLSTSIIYSSPYL